MPLAVAFSGTLGHGEWGEWEDRLRLRPLGEGVSTVRIARFLITRVKGEDEAKDKKDETKPASVQFLGEVEGERAECMADITEADIPADSTEPIEAALDEVFSTHFVIVKGSYSNLHIQIDVEVEEGEEASQFELETTRDGIHHEDGEETVEGEEMEVLEEEGDGEEEVEGEEEKEEGGEEQAGDAEEELIEDEDVEEHDELDLMSILSGDLDVEDVVEMDEEEKKALAEAREAEDREKREKDEKETEELEKDFTMDAFKPAHIRCRRPPWRERSAMCDAKGWELFCDAVATFHLQSSLEKEIDDWLATIESLVPQLKACLRHAEKKPVPVENVNLAQMLAEWSAFGLSILMAATQPSPAHFLRVGISLVEEIAGYSHQPKYAATLLDRGLAGDLTLIFETGYTQLHVSAMQALHSLQSCRGVCAAAASALYRPMYLHEAEEMEDDANDNGEAVLETSVYDRVVCMAAVAEERGESTCLVSLCMRIVARADVNRAVADLRKGVACLAQAKKSEEHKKQADNEAPFLAQMIATFIDKFKQCQAVMRETGRVEDALRAFSVLADCDWPAMLCVLLSHPHPAPLTPLLAFTEYLLDQQECVGLFALAESSGQTQLLLLKLLQVWKEETKERVKEGEGEEEESSHDIILQSPKKKTGKRKQQAMQFVSAEEHQETPDVCVPGSGVDEAICRPRPPSAASLAYRIALRLTVLRLCDRLADANRDLSLESVDEDCRVAELHSLLRMTVSEEGEKAVCCVLSECGYSQLASILLVNSESGGGLSIRQKSTLRQSTAYAYAVEIMLAVAKRARSGRFWIRNAKHYQRMIKYQHLSTGSPLNSWWDPFRDVLVASADTGSRPDVSAIHQKLSSLSKEYADGDPPLASISLVRLLAYLLDPTRALTETAEAARLETLAACLAEGVHSTLEAMLKTALSYRMTLWLAGCSVECEDALLFREFALAVISCLHPLYSDALSASKSVKGVSVNIVGLCVSLWALTTGFSGAVAEVGDEARQLRRAVLGLLTHLCGWGVEGEVQRDWEGKSAATRVIRRIGDYGVGRLHCQPAALSLLWLLRPYVSERSGEEDEVRGLEDSHLNEYFEALEEAAKPIAGLFLSSVPYSRQLAAVLFDRFVHCLPRKTLSALARAVWLRLMRECSTRPTTGNNQQKGADAKAKQKKPPAVDMPDLPILFARSRQTEMIEMLYCMTQSSGRFKLALLDVLCKDEECSQRLSIFTGLFASVFKQPNHIKFQETASLVLLTLCDFSLFEEVAQIVEGKAEGDEFMEEVEDDDRDVVILEDDDMVDATAEDEKDEIIDDNKCSVAHRVCRALVRLATARPASNDQSLLAIRTLEKIATQPHPSAAETVRRAWFESRVLAGPRILFHRLSMWLFPAKGTDAKNGRTTVGPAGSILASTTDHLLKLFGQDKYSRTLYELLELDSVEFPKRSETYEKYLTETRKKRQRAEERKKKNEKEKKEKEEKEGEKAADKDDDEDKPEDEEEKWMLEEEIGDEGEEETGEGDSFPVHPAVRLMLRLKKRQEDKGVTAEAAIVTKLAALIDLAEKGREGEQGDVGLEPLLLLRVKEEEMAKAESEEGEASTEKRIIVKISSAHCETCKFEDRVFADISKYTKHGRTAGDRLVLAQKGGTAVKAPAARPTAPRPPISRRKVIRPPPPGVPLRPLMSRPLPPPKRILPAVRRGAPPPKRRR